MWRPWAKSAPNKSGGRENPSTNFRCSSFKDIANLCIDHPDFLLSSSSNHQLEDEPTPPIHNHKRKPSIFHRVHTANALLRQWPGRSDPPPDLNPKPKPETANDGGATSPGNVGPEARIVLYYTSLRVVRSTFEACRAAQSILQGFRVAVDERDLAMDSGFMSELQQMLGLGAQNNKSEKVMTLPRVFIGGRYIGGAEEVKHLHEIGELKKLVEGFPLAKPGTCDTCGGYRFVLCSECSGSHKVFSDKIGFRSCTACNENGLIRCTDCCCPSLSRPILS